MDFLRNMEGSLVWAIRPESPGQEGRGYLHEKKESSFLQAQGFVISEKARCPHNCNARMFPR